MNGDLNWILNHRILSGPYINLTVAEKFYLFAGEKPKSGCWEWKRTRYKNGYGSFTIHETHMLAHKISYMLYHNVNIPKGINILHSCDNPPCIDHRHLIMGTQRENILDMRRKGRQGCDTLVEEQVLEIRKLYQTGKYRQQDLAEK